MNEPEDTTSGKTVSHTKTSTESDMGQKSASSVQEGCGERGNMSNNTRNSLASTNKYYKVDIEAFEAVLALKNEKVELKKFFHVFRVNISNYTVRGLKNAKGALLLVQDMEDTKSSFGTKN